MLDCFGLSENFRPIKFQIRPERKAIIIRGATFAGAVAQSQSADFGAVKLGGGWPRQRKQLFSGNVDAALDALRGYAGTPHLQGFLWRQPRLRERFIQRLAKRVEPLKVLLAGDLIRSHYKTVG